jgi:uncharacterized membrane-anchored protein
VDHALEAETEALLQKAQKAVQAGDWSTAKQGFESALEHGQAGEALFGLGIALQWLGDSEVAIRYRERRTLIFAGVGMPSRRCSPRSTCASAIG